MFNTRDAPWETILINFYAEDDLNFELKFWQNIRLHLICKKLILMKFVLGEI